MQYSLILLASVAAMAKAFIAKTSVFAGRQRFSCKQVGPLFAESIEEIKLESEDRMAKSVESVRINLGTIRTGRANSAILDRVKVKYYGVDTPLNQMASISVSSAQQVCR